MLEYQLDAWGWHTVGVVGLGHIWHQFRQNALWMLGLTGSLSMLILAWIWLIDRRIMRPAQRQSLRLQESDALGRFVIEVAGVGLMIVERSTRQVLLANAAAKSIIEQATAAGLAQLQDACDARLTSGHANVEGPPQVLPRFDVDTAGRSGDMRSLEVRLVEITYEGRAAVLYALNDVTEARRSEARLREAIRAADAANHAKSSFLATMSHEIRTPLNGMLGSIELLGMTRLDLRQRDQLAVMQHASQSLIYIINDVLDFSKIEAGQMSLQLRPCRVEEVVEDVTRRFAAEAARKQLWLLCINDPSLVEPVMADVVKLEQILTNLVSNAVKFTEQGKVIVAAMRKPGGGVEIRVIDTGIGIAGRDQIRLFEPFVQAEQPDTRHYGGTGLGLSICRRLVELMSGEIRVVSEPGLGSCFTVRVLLHELRLGRRPVRAAIGQRDQGGRCGRMAVVVVQGWERCLRGLFWKGVFGGFGTAGMSFPCVIANGHCFTAYSPRPRCACRARRSPQHLPVPSGTHRAKPNLKDRPIRRIAHRKIPICAVCDTSKTLSQHLS